MVMEAEHDRANHIVQSRAETAASHDAARKRRRIEEQVASRSGHLHCCRSTGPLATAFCAVDVHVIENALVVVDEAHAAHGRRDATLAEACNREVGLGVTHTNVSWCAP